jgi:hypothetical protein
MLRWCLLLVASSSVACAGGGPQYPEVRVATSDLKLLVDDRRPEKSSDFKSLGALERDEKYTFPVLLRADALLQRLEGRVARLRGSGNVPVVVRIEVQRCDATYFSHYTDEFVRYDVGLHFEVRGPNGALLGKGKGSAWRQIPREEATEAARAEAQMGAALEAFDLYFAHEGHLTGINLELRSLANAH